MNQTTYALEVHDISKSYATVQAVDNLSFAVEKGEIFGLLGPNGAGKTTTIRMALDIIKPSAGEISVLGGPMSKEKKPRIGYLPEEVIFRGFLVTQVYLMLKGKISGHGRLVTASVLISQLIFSLSHIPQRIYNGYSPLNLLPQSLASMGVWYPVRRALPAHREHLCRRGCARPRECAGDGRGLAIEDLGRSLTAYPGACSHRRLGAIDVLE